MCLESSTNLSLERAREYDRVSEWLAKHKKPSSSQTIDPLDTYEGLKTEYGIEGRRLQFQKDSYRQPVLTRKQMCPKNYRRGQPDFEAERCTSRLRELRAQNSDTTSSDRSRFQLFNQKSMNEEDRDETSEDEGGEVLQPVLGNPNSSLV